MKLIKFSIISTLFLLHATCLFAQGEANRYVNAYKQYETAACPIEEDEIKHFVYFARDREAIHDHPFLEASRFEGAQIMYSWHQLESAEGLKANMLA